MNSIDIVDSLRSLYPLKKFEEDAIMEVVGKCICSQNSETKEKLVIEEKARIKDFRNEAADIASGCLTEWLSKRGYFTVPAAKSHHGAYIGGLYEHSKQVAMELKNITERMGLIWQRPESPLIIGFLHDICKTEMYKIVPNDSENGYSIEFSKENTFPGHGEASTLLLQQYMLETGIIALTEEELFCIRYHMGTFTDKSEWEYYTKAVKKYPNVLWTHVADMIASQIKDI